MPYLTLIGRVDENKSGVGSRGYHIYRKGMTVYFYWGRVTVSAGNKPFTWSHDPQTRRPIKYATEANAAYRVRSERERLIAEGYHLLPKGVRIKRRRPAK